MADESWTKNRHTPNTQDIYHGYEQWKKGHKQLQERTDAPKTGRDYVENASNIITFLEGFAELNAIAKTVVVLFRTVVTLELNKRENDAHVDIVFLEMADMMSTLLDTSQFSETISKQTKDGNLSVAQKLRAEFVDIEKEISNCANSMDTYSKESRIKRFMKSAEWKSRITSHITTFRLRNTKLQQILTLQIASDVNSLVDRSINVDAKMDLLISHVFSPNSDWEKAAAKKARQYSKMKDGKNLANNPEYLEALILDSKLNPEGTNGNKFAMIEQLQKDLRLSVEDVCKENKESFERKLHYYTEQLEKSMKTNADYIVKKLSGPYDRLKHKDLKSLWKKMKWIFCIDNDHFTSALFEYYLDHFSSIKVLKDGQVEFDDEESSDERTTEENITIVKDLTRRGALNHPDKWTLIPMAKYKDRIAHAIDSDDSRLIRISEVNTFTDRMPKGWSVPQWCAYAAVGWTYQARCYRKRINTILSRMHELQAKVLPANRDRVITMNRSCIPFYQLLAWEPWETPDAKYPIPNALELRNLVFNKMKTDDNEMQNKLKGMEWNVEDETMISPEGEPLETYVLQLSVLLLERMYQAMQSFSGATVDGKEIARLKKSLQYLQQMCLNRIAEVKATGNKTKENHKGKEDIDHFYGGIWGCINRVILLKDKLPFKQKDVGDFRHDEDSVLAEFDQDQTNSPVHQDIAKEAITPFTHQECSICQKGPGEGHRYVCTECNAIICSECYERQPSGHTFTHTMLRFSLDTVANRLDWMMLDAEIQKQRIYTEMMNFEWSQTAFCPEDEPEETENAEDEETSPFRCSDCKEAILLEDETDITFYKCFGHSCSEYYLCKSCSDDCANLNGHQWWHSLIVLRSQVILEELKKMEEGDSDAESTYSDSDGDDIAVVVSKLDATHLMLQNKMDTLLDGNTVQNADLESRISQLMDNKVGAMLTELRGNGNEGGVSGILDSRMAQLEGKLESIVDEMRKYFNPSAPSPRAPFPPGREVSSKSDSQEDTRFNGNGAESNDRRNREDTGFDGDGVEGNNGRNQEDARFDRDDVEDDNNHDQEETRSDGDSAKENDKHNQDDAKSDGDEINDNRDQEDARSDGDEINDNRDQEDARSDGDGVEGNDDRNQDAKFDRDSVEDDNNLDQEETRSDGDSAEGNNKYNQEDARSDGDESNDDRNQEDARTYGSGVEDNDSNYAQVEERDNDDDRDDDAGDRYDRAWPRRSDYISDDNGDPPEDSVPEGEGDFW